MRNRPRSVNARPFRVKSKPNFNKINFHWRPKERANSNRMGWLAVSWWPDEIEEIVIRGLCEKTLAHAWHMSHAQANGNNRFHRMETGDTISLVWNKFLVRRNAGVWSSFCLKNTSHVDTWTVIKDAHFHVDNRLDKVRWCKIPRSIHSSTKDDRDNNDHDDEWKFKLT